MSIIAIICVIWLAAVLDKAMKHQKAKQAALSAQMAKEREAQRKINERLAKEQERQERAQAAAWERQRKEDERRDAQLAKHEAEIRNLKHRVKECEKSYLAAKQTLENLNELYELASADLDRAVNAGDSKAKEKALRKIVSLDKQIETAEKERDKAKFDWNTANKKLSA